MHMSSGHLVAAGHYLAAQAGHEILAAGGNAVDAGVAAGICLGVLQSDIVNLGGVAPILIWVAETGQVVTISGLGLGRGKPARRLSGTSMMAKSRPACCAASFPRRPMLGSPRSNALEP